MSRHHSRAQQVVCLRCQRVAGVADDRHSLIKQFAVHMAEHHDFTSGALLENKDFQLEPAPFRCDVCGVVVEPPIWNYKSHVDIDYMSDDWLVCFTCHELITAKKIVALYQRVIDVNMETYPLKRSDVMNGTLPVLQKFLNGRYDTPVREDVL